MGETEQVGTQLRAGAARVHRGELPLPAARSRARRRRPLLDLGVIDSLGFVELVEEVQTRYGIAIEDVEITEENFGSIAAIAEFVERKRPA